MPTNPHYEIEFSAYKAEPPKEQHWWKFGNTSAPDDLVFYNYADVATFFEGLRATARDRRLRRTPGTHYTSYPRLFRIVIVDDDGKEQIGDMLDCDTL
jgi:hypothetical protein